MRGPRELAQRAPLRIKLVAAVLVLVAVALGVAGLVATASLRGYLTDRVDGQLAQASDGPYFLRGRAVGGAGIPPAGDGRFRPPSQYYYQVADADGTVLALYSNPLDSGQSPPQLPTLDATTVARVTGAPFTVPSQGHGAPWRVLVRALPDGSVAVATNLGDVDNTVARLTYLELVVGVAMMLLVAGVGYVVVRNSLRPLVEVEGIAAAIAAGDLSRRIPDRDQRTEVGRLSGALNGMLTQIESAFREREASEGAAKASEERMRRFVADASHELRTPLTSIRGFAELYRQGAADDPQALARLMRRIEDEAARMGLLVEDLLLLARLDQQRPLERAPVDLLDLVADAVHDARAVAPARRIELEVAADCPPPVVTGDEARLRQVLANLVTNALTHTPPQTPVTVRLGVRRPPDGRALAVLEVADDGPGLAPDDAARVFERFYRTDRSRTRAHGGTGLGLSIVAALVAAHAGRVELETAPGQGAVFRVLLPMPAESADPQSGRTGTPETETAHPDIGLHTVK